MDNPRARRKMQNRLNQRASRRRRALLSSSNSRPSARKWTFYVSPSQSIRKCSVPDNKDLAEEDASSTFIGFSCYLRLETRQTALERLWDRVNRGVSAHILSSELLFPVTQWNLISAMYTNAATMGLTRALLAEDIVSSFNTYGPTRNLPPSLRPTALQKSVIHHPWIDLFAVSSVRDTLLRNLHLYSEDELCHDLVSCCSSSDCGQSTGLLIWGDGSDPSVYELSEGMARKWAWLWHECTDILESTNYWRLQRGEKPIILAD